MLDPSYEYIFCTWFPPCADSRCHQQLIDQSAQLASTSSQLSLLHPAASRARGLNKFIVAIGFDSCNVEYLDLDRPDAGWNILTQIPEMRYGLSGAGLAAHGDTLIVTGGVGRGGVLKGKIHENTKTLKTLSLVF
jgi:hypothetical protein